MTIDFEKLLKDLREKKKMMQHSSLPQEQNQEVEGQESFFHNGRSVTYNSRQLEAIRLAKELKSFVLIGAAGTGKTTTMKGLVEELCRHPEVFPIKDDGHKHLRGGSPGIIAVSFTRRSVANDKRAVPENMTANCLTFHKALEYQPVYYEIIDDNGDIKKTMRFEEQRTAEFPLPPGIRVCIISEASMVSTFLFKKLEAALPKDCVFIFTGDIQQLPPVFGSAILGYKLNELPVIELTEVYRQALDSPIISLAHRILSGNPITYKELPTIGNDGKGVWIYPLKKKFAPEVGLVMATKLLLMSKEERQSLKSYQENPALFDAFGTYNPEEDMILCPFNKAFGTIEINKTIANHLAKAKGRKVFEIIAGITKSYYSIGDKVIFDKEDAVITNISRNSAYLGKRPQEASETLDYWGKDSVFHAPTSDSLEDIEDMFHRIAQANEDGEGDTVRQASHTVTIRLTDSGIEETLTTAGDIRKLDLSYALTVHKAQGAEYNKTFLLFHHSHSKMIQRELLYTAVTRAAKELFVICEQDTFEKGITSQKIKGKTWQDKAEAFKGKMITNEEEI